MNNAPRIVPRAVPAPIPPNYQFVKFAEDYRDQIVVQPVYKLWLPVRPLVLVLFDRRLGLGCRALWFEHRLFRPIEAVTDWLGVFVR